DRRSGDVGDGGTQAAGVERRPRLPHDRFGDVDAERTCAALGRPLKDPGVLRLVPEVGLEKPEIVESWQRLEQETDLVGAVERRRRRAGQDGEVVADVVPEAAIRAVTGRGHLVPIVPART